MSERRRGRMLLDNSAWSHILRGRLPASVVVDFEAAVKADEVLDATSAEKLSACITAQSVDDRLALALG